MPIEVVVSLIALAGAGTAGLWTWFRTRRKTEADVAVAQQSALSERFDDASQLAQYIREEVERQVAPIRAELQNVKVESHEMHDAVRARETQLWLWDQRGRAGDLPMLPAPILDRLGLIHLIASDISENTEPT